MSPGGIWNLAEPVDRNHLPPGDLASEIRVLQHFCSIFAAFLQHFCCIFAAFLQHFCSIFAAFLHFEALQDFRTWDSIFCTSGWVRSWLRIARGTLIESSPSSDAMLVPTGLEITTPNIGIPKCKDKVLQNLTN